MAEAGSSPTDLHRSRLFFGICLALIPTGASFALMSNVVSQLKIEFILSNVQVAWIVGASVWGMAISLVGIGPFLEFFGLKNGARLAFLGHLMGITLFIAGVTKRGDPSAFWILLAGAVLLAMGNGMIEVTGNPLVAALYPDEKTKRLNWFHAFFPIGLISGGIAGFLLGTYGGSLARWPYQLAMIYIPILVYGVMVLPQKFPKTENAEAGLPYSEMWKAVLTSPLMWLMLAMMAITTSFELGPMRWIPSVLQAGGIHGILVLVWISGWMMVLRFMSGHAVAKLSPPGMLLGGAVLAGSGLLLLSFAKSTPAAFAAATVYAFGVAFFFPTMVGTVSERMPRTGSLGIVLTAGIGLGMSGLVMQPFMGKLADRYLAEALPAQTAEFLQRASARLGEYESRGQSADPATLGYRVEDITLAKRDVDAAIATGSVNNNATATALRAIINTALQNEPIVGEAGAILQPAENTGGQQSFRYVAPLALILVLVFGVMYINDKRKGGYRAVKLEKAAMLLFALALPSFAQAQRGGASADRRTSPQRAGAQVPRAQTARLRVLFIGDNGHHNPTARAKSLLPYLAKDGIDLYYTDDLDDLNPAELARYDALMLYTNYLTISDPQVAAMLGFVGNGGGLVVLHCASASFQNSEEYLKLIGASFKSHGTGVFSAVRIMPEHPILKGIPAWENWEETYVHTRHNPVDRTVLEVRRENGHDEPWTWVRTYGKGRVFYTAWGHDQRTWLQPGFQKMVENATRWTIGDWAMSWTWKGPLTTTMDLTVPLPTYKQRLPDGRPAPWNTPGDSGITKAQKALGTRESLEMMTLRPGFSVKPFAMEPLIGNIIDFTWDARGRMWAVETNDYPSSFAPDTGANAFVGTDRILIIDDTNGDGIADRTKVYADKLNLATSLVLVKGGVIVGQAPLMLFLGDANGDDKADSRKILFDGFSRSDTHGSISNLRYGFDNRIWGSNGYNGFRDTVGKRVYVRGGLHSFGSGYYRFPADGSELEYLVRTSNNTWGIGLTEDNFLFGSTANSVPSVFSPVPIDYYRNAGIREPTAGVGAFRISDRIDIFPNTDILQVDQFGNYTAGAGKEIYTARSFPREYWNRTSFVAEPTGHVIGMFDITDNGSSFREKNRWSFMASRDAWAAPVQMKVGPDGALWVSDFYTLVAQHNPTPDSNVYKANGNLRSCCRTGRGAAYETPNRDKLHGRIYRIMYDSARPTPTARLDNATPAQLVAALKNENMFWRLTAQRLLVDRGNRDVLPALIRLASDQTVDELGLNPGALHALWTMEGLGAARTGEGLAVVRKALYHPAASVRRAALQILPRNEQLVTDIMAAGILPDRSSPWPVEYTVASSLLEDPDAHVRIEALLALSELPANPRVASAAAEMLFVPDNARDQWMPDAIAIVGSKQGTDFLSGVLERRLPNDTASLSGIARAVNLTASSRASAADEALVQVVAGAGKLNAKIARSLLQGIENGWPDEKAPVLTDQQRAALRAAAKSLMDANPAPAPDAGGGGRGGRGGGGRGGGQAGQGGPNEPFAPIFSRLGTKWGSPTLFAQQ
jgi:putative membrane-bound dehydrogenase-like protein